jgi:hypothetical protein
MLKLLIGYSLVCLCFYGNDVVNAKISCIGEDGKPVDTYVNLFFTFFTFEKSSLYWSIKKFNVNNLRVYMTLYLTYRNSK